MFNRLLLWHGGTGTLVGEWEEPGGRAPLGAGVHQVVSAGGGTALTIRDDGSLAAWHTSPEAWVANLCDQFGDLDAGQRERYLPAVNTPPTCPGPR